MFGKIIQSILDLGPTVVLPIIITVFGVILGQGFKKSFRAGLIIGVGFVGINLVVGLLMTTLGPITEALVKNTGVQMDIMDVGWPIGASISFGTPIAMILIPVILGLNIILLAVNFTKTMDVDLWNYWHFIFAGSVAYYSSNSIVLGIVVACITAAITFKLADWTAPVLEHHFGLPGVSLPHSETVNYAPIMYLLNKIEDKIPGLNKLDANPDTLRKRFGIFGEPLMMGLILGMLIAIVAGFTWTKVITVGIGMAAVLVLLPKMVALLMEGLIPLSEGAREFIRKRFPGKDVYIGLDAAIVIGHPANMAVAIIMVPITLALAFGLNALGVGRMLPFADLAVLPFTLIWAVAASRGNIIRGLINSIFTVCIALTLATALAPLLTTMGHVVGFAFPAGASSISSIDVGSHIIPFILINILNFQNGSAVILGLVLAVVYAGIWYFVRNDIKRQYASELGLDVNQIGKKSNKTIKA